MATYDAEPGPDPTRPYRPQVPSPMPRRVPEAFASLVDEQPQLVRATTEAEAREVAMEVRAAVHWLKTWGNTAEGEALWEGVQRSPEVFTRNGGKGLDVRATPYVRFFYVIPGHAAPVDARHALPGDISSATDQFWGCNYFVHPPENTGLRAANRVTREEVQAKAQAGIKEKVIRRKGVPAPDDRATGEPEPPRRTVAVRRTEVLPARATRTLITERTPRPGAWGFSCFRGPSTRGMRCCRKIRLTCGFFLFSMPGQGCLTDGSVSKTGTRTYLHNHVPSTSVSVS
jgi:hypothetical protein